MLNSKEITTSFLIADLAGYTSLTETHGDLLAANLVYRYKEIVGEILLNLVDDPSPDRDKYIINLIS